MKNKMKIVSLLVIIVCMWQVLTGCQSSPKEIVYESEIVDVSLGAGTENITVEGNLWPDPQGQAGEKGARSCDFMGKHLTGEYTSSWSYVCTPIVSDRFRTSEGYEFYLDRKTGELVSISFMGSDYFETEPLLEDVENPEETAVEIATNLAKDYIQISDYKRTVRLNIYAEGTDEEIRTYGIEFVKYIQDYGTPDSMSVYVSSKGNLRSVHWGYIGGLDDVSFEIDKQKVNDSVLAKVKEIYAATQYTLLDMEIKDSMLGRTQQGELGIRSRVAVELKSGDGVTFETLLGVFTYLRYE